MTHLQNRLQIPMSTFFTETKEILEIVLRKSPCICVLNELYHSVLNNPLHGRDDLTFYHMMVQQFPSLVKTLRYNHCNECNKGYCRVCEINLYISNYGYEISGDPIESFRIKEDHEIKSLEWKITSQLPLAESNDAFYAIIDKLPQYKGSIIVETLNAGYVDFNEPVTSDQLQSLFINAIIEPSIDFVNQVRQYSVSQE